MRAEARPPTPALDRRAILVVPYMWIGDFVRCHSVVKLLKARYPGRPVDMLSTTLCAPLADYMPELRQVVVVDLPRNRLAYAEHAALAERLKPEHYGTALVMPRTGTLEQGAHGVSAFYVDLRAPGVSRARFRDLGTRAIGRGQLFFRVGEVQAVDPLCALQHILTELRRGAAAALRARQGRGRDRRRHRRRHRPDEPPSSNLFHELL